MAVLSHFQERSLLQPEQKEQKETSYRQ